MKERKKVKTWEFIVAFIFLFYKSCNISSFYCLLFHHLSPISHWKQLPPKWTKPSTNLTPNAAAQQWGPQSGAPLQTSPIHFLSLDACIESPISVSLIEMSELVYSPAPSPALFLKTITSKTPVLVHFSHRPSPSTPWAVCRWHRYYSLTCSHLSSASVSIDVSHWYYFFPT